LGYLLLFYAGWATLSTFWADEPLLTGRRLMVFWLLVISAFAVAARLSLKETAMMTFFITLTTLLLSIGAELKLNAFYPFQSGYRFSGVMNPVAQGWNCGLLAISAVFLSTCLPRYRVALMGMLPAAFLFLLFTRSRMPLASALMALTLYWTLSSSVSKILASVCGLIVALCLVYFVAGDQLIRHADAIIHLGRGDEALENVRTFTGRTLLWRECINYVADRPLWGHGYEVFLSPALLAKVSAAIGWIPANSHSGFIQNLLGLGIIGLAAFTGIFVCSLQRAWSLCRLSRDYLFMITVLAWLCANLLLEATIIIEPIFPAFLSMVLLIKAGFVELQPNYSRVSTVGQTGLKTAGQRRVGYRV
jgi:O-antigen ligase